jgi:hypothetical protein
LGARSVGSSSLSLHLAWSASSSLWLTRSAPAVRASRISPERMAPYPDSDLSATRRGPGNGCCTGHGSVVPNGPERATCWRLGAGPGRRPGSSTSSAERPGTLGPPGPALRAFAGPGSHLGRAGAGAHLWLEVRRRFDILWTAPAPTTPRRAWTSERSVGCRKRHHKVAVEALETSQRGRSRQPVVQTRRPCGTAIASAGPATTFRRMQRQSPPRCPRLCTRHPWSERAGARLRRPTR